MIACKDCKHFVEPLNCGLYKNGFDYVNGTDLYRTCADARTDRSKCSHAGKDFEQKDEPLGFFERFLKRE